VSGPMPSAIRPLREGVASLRALMTSALPLLNKALASRAVSPFRVWGSWSERSCHQLEHTSPRAGGFRTRLASTSAWLASLLAGQTLDHKACWRRVSPLVDDPMGPPRGFTLDATPTQHGPHDPCRLVRPRPRRAVPPSTLEQPPYPWAATVRSQLHPAPRRPGPGDQQLAPGARAPRADPSPSRLPPRGVLRGHHPSPGGKLAAILDPPDSTYGSDQRGRGDGANPWNRQQPLALRRRLGPACERLVVRGDLRL
jgi:hypothetical protein